MLHGDNEEGRVPEHTHPGGLLEGRSIRPREPGSPVWEQKEGCAAPFEMIWEALRPPAPGRVLALRDKAPRLSVWEGLQKGSGQEWSLGGHSGRVPAIAFALHLQVCAVTQCSGQSSQRAYDLARVRQRLTGGAGLKPHQIKAPPRCASQRQSRAVPHTLE